MLYQLSLILAAQIICMVPLFMNEDDDRTIKVQIAPGKRSRTLTLIYNVPEDRQTLLLQMLKKKMSCGGTINKEKKYLQLQGDFKENICDYLKQQFPEHNVVIGTGDIKGLTASPRDMPSGTASQIVTNPDESKKSHSGHKKTAFCIRDGILEKTDDDRLGAFIQDIKRKEKACCIFTFITFKSDKRNDLDDLIDDLKQFLKSFLEDDARSIYSEKLGMEVFWITEPNEEYEFLFTEGIDHLEAVYDKLHLLVLNQIYKIAYDIVRGEAISLLERALADIYDKRQEELTTKEMFIVEARKKVSDLIEALKGGCSLDISFEESPWKRCCRKEDPYFFETDFVKFEKTIGHKFLSCKKRFKKVVKQLICKKFREYVKGIVSDIIPAFLPILQEEDNIEDIVDYMFDVYNVVQRRMLEASSYDTHESVSEFTKDYIEMSSSSKIENNLKRTYKRDILPGLKRKFECRKTQFLDELKIVKITRIFSHSYEIADVNHKQLCEVLMNTSMCEESGGEPVLVNDENGKAFKEVGKLRSDGITEEEKKDLVLYGFTYDVMAQDSQELSAINTD